MPPEIEKIFFEFIFDSKRFRSETFSKIMILRIFREKSLKSAISEVLLKGSESDFESSLFELGDFLELVWFKIVVTLKIHTQIENPNFEITIFEFSTNWEKNSNFFQRKLVVKKCKISIEFESKVVSDTAWFTGQTTHFES